MSKEMRLRAVYGILIALTGAAGLTARAMRASYPNLGDAAGDALWAAMVFLIVSFLFVSRTLKWRAFVALGFAFAIEFSQLYHAGWIDEIRATTIGAMVLGSTFVLLDLLWYAGGVAVGAAVAPKR